MIGDSTTVASRVAVDAREGGGAGTPHHTERIIGSHRIVVATIGPPETLISIRSSVALR